MVGCAVTLDTSFAQFRNREYRTVNKVTLLNSTYNAFTYKCKQTTHGKIKRKLYAANIKLNDSVRIFINISFKDRLLINMTLQNSVGDFNQKAVCTSITKHV